MKTRALVILLVILGVAVGGFLVYRNIASARAGAASTLQTAVVTRDTLEITVNAAGAIAAPQSATLVWRASGVVGAVHVALGDLVQPGDLLIELDPDSLDRTTIQAQADLINAQKELDALLAGPTALQIAQANLAIVQARQAVSDTERRLRYALNPVGQSLFDAVKSAQVAYDTAQAELQLQHVSPDATAVHTYSNNLIHAQGQQERAQRAYDDCLAVQCALLERYANELNAAKNAYQTAWDNLQAAQLTYDTKVAQLSNTVDQTRAALEEAQTNLAAAQAGPDAALVALYQAQLEVDKANLAQAQDDLTELMAGPDPDDVAAAQARVAAAQAAVGLSRITAPFAGTVVAIYSRPGDGVNSNQTAIALADLSTLELEVDVSEVDVNNLALGQTATLTLDALPGQSFTGSVAEVGRMGTSQQGVVTFPVKVVIPSPDRALRPGMTAAVSIVTERRENALLVPNRAVRLAAGQRFVVVLFEGQQIQVPVTLGRSDETMSEVLDGALREGDTVVISASTAQTAQGFGPGFFGGGFQRP